MKYSVLLTMTETALLTFDTDTPEQAIELARNTDDVDFDLEGCDYTIVETGA